MTKQLMIGLILSLSISGAFSADDPMGVLRKPIPDKLVVLTFDDGPLSGYTVCAPIMKSFGFGGSFYVCDFDSFKTRKDWYMTWRQMKAMAADGFEIGNHSVGHGSGLGPMLALDDELLAHDVPQPTTIAWPVFAVAWNDCPALASNGYIFARGGHFRPYRPTVDNPFDVPCLGAGTVEEFVKNVRQATGGKIAVIIYHGVPDMEHPAVSLDPAVFKVQMQYLKDNNYKVIALRDLAEYIDPVKAAKLPRTENAYKDTGPVVLASEEKAPVPVDMPKGVPAKKPSANKSKVVRETDSSQPNVFTWNSAKEGTWSPGSRWSNDLARETAPLNLESDLTANVTQNGDLNLQCQIFGKGRLIKNGEGRLQISDRTNTYEGGTVVNDGSLFLLAANHALGAGPLTLNNDALINLEHVDGTNPLILNGGEIYGGNGFGDSWNAPIILNDNIRFSAYAGFHLNNKSGSMSGPGGFTMAGGHGGFGPSNSGWLTIWGANTYSGPTIVRLGTLIVKKAASLYNGDASQWIPAKITVFNTATLILSVGGAGEFTGPNIDAMLKNLTTGINSNGLMGGAVLVLDTANATGTVILAADITDSKGQRGGPFTIRKGGAGTMQLAGENTFSGKIGADGGTLIVSSLNSVVGGKSSSSLGAPKTLEDAVITLGGDCTLMYTGKGEVTDRIIDLTGEKQTLTLDQSGSGLLKFASPFDISGFGHNKTIVLKGTGSGELAGSIRNPYDRKKAANLALTKEGAGIWTLSGVNSFSGSTTVKQGTLSLASSKSLGDKTEVSVADGATLDLYFKGEIKVSKLTLGGTVQPAGTYSSANAPKFIKGKGLLKN